MGLIIQQRALQAAGGCGRCFRSFGSGIGRSSTKSIER